LRDEEVFSAARGIIEPMMRWYEDVDGNFIEQFQTTGFDARIWELYLFAAFREMGYRIQHIRPAPDFMCANPLAAFGVEATTVNPSRDASGAVVPEPPRDTPEQVRAYLTEYMPIKFGSALTSKLAKRYWEQPHMVGIPLLFALQDFSGRRSMTMTRSAFEKYIYGYAHDWERDASGKLIINPRKIGTHRWGTKEIPSGFFDLPEAENVSAVVFSNGGTISKFNRVACRMTAGPVLTPCSSMTKTKGLKLPAVLDGCEKQSYRPFVPVAEPKKPDPAKLTGNART
jgi:hypothetical protein